MPEEPTQEPISPPLDGIFRKFSQANIADIHRLWKLLLSYQTPEIQVYFKNCSLGGVARRGGKMVFEVTLNCHPPQWEETIHYFDGLQYHPITISLLQWRG